MFVKDRVEEVAPDITGLFETIVPEPGVPLYHWYVIPVPEALALRFVEVLAQTTLQSRRHQRDRSTA